jgi:hypothetical protein
MELSSTENAHLEAFISKAQDNVNSEFEVIFRKTINHCRTAELNSTEFFRVLNYFRSNYTPFFSGEMMNIQAEQDPGTGMMSSIRFIITGMNDIRQFCTDDTLTGKMYHTVNKVLDRTVPAGPKLDINEYGIRCTLKNEIDVNRENPRVRKILSEWPTSRKYYRFLRRNSFITKDGLFRIDFSIVKSPGRDSSGKDMYVTRFAETDIFKNRNKYEIELEYIGTKNKITAEIPAIKKSFGQQILAILRLIHDGWFITKQTVKDRVCTQYTTMIEKISNSYKEFCGRMPATISMENMRPKTEHNHISIQTNYAVTEKADGARVLGFIPPGSTTLYLITQSMEILNSGLEVDAPGTLLDCEWLRENGLNILKYFDIYFFKGRDVANLPFYSIDDSTESRYYFMETLFTPIEKVARNSKYSAQLSLKKYQFVDGFVNNSIWEACHKVLLEIDAKSFGYKCDGIIFMPTDLTVGGAYPGDSALLNGSVWGQNLKWKPANENTIDFLVKYEKDRDTGKDRIYHLINPATGSINAYKNALLYVYTDTEKSYSFSQAVLNMNWMEEKLTNKMEIVPFTPTEPVSDTAGHGYMKLEMDDSAINRVMTSVTGEIVEDETIVEMVYHPDQHPDFRWTMNKIRHDKTERYQMGKLYHTANSVITANNIWKNIHAPITAEMLKTGDYIPTTIEEESALENMTIYYKRTQPRKDNYTQNMVDFHNIYVKSELLIKAVLRPGTKLMDIACGKGNDIHKWRMFGAGFVFGIDISKDNIYNYKDGAWRRYIDLLKKEKCNSDFHTCPAMVFTRGDASKNIRTLEAATEPQDRNIIAAIYGTSSTDVKSTGEPLLRKIYGIGAGGFDAVTSMFAIHYFFQSEGHLDSFIRNLVESTHEGSYFAGCCFDGEIVFNKLKYYEPESFLTRNDDSVGGKLIWQIQKKYTQDTFPANKDSLGMQIKVLIESIGQPFNEYLVHFDYLVQKLNDVGFRLLTDKEARDIGLRKSTDTFDNTFAMMPESGTYGKSHKMTSLEKELSFMNRWFVFKRTSK